MPSPYQILGITPSATQAQIKEAYRKRAQHTHPDRTGGTTEAFREVQAAYEVLQQREQRALKLLQDLFTQVIDSGAWAGNLIETAKAHVGQANREHSTKLVALNKTLQKLTTYQGRVVSKSADNVYAKVLQQRIDTVVGQIDEIQLTLQSLIELSTLLEDYEDTAPEATTVHTWSSGDWRG